MPKASLGTEDRSRMLSRWLQLLPSGMPTAKMSSTIPTADFRRKSAASAGCWPHTSRPSPMVLWHSSATFKRQQAILAVSGRTTQWIEPITMTKVMPTTVAPSHRTTTGINFFLQRNGSNGRPWPLHNHSEILRRVKLTPVLPISPLDCRTACPHHDHEDPASNRLLLWWIPNRHTLIGPVATRAIQIPPKPPISAQERLDIDTE